MTPLDPTTCNHVEKKGKKKDLLAAYAIAAENQSLGYYKQALQDHQDAVQAEADEREAKKGSKGKRKSDAAEPDAVDYLSDHVSEMSLAEEKVASKPKSKKRKKEASSDDDDEEKVSLAPASLTDQI